jgi:hypothetical protein
MTHYMHDRGHSTTRHDTTPHDTTRHDGTARLTPAPQAHFKMYGPYCSHCKAANVLVSELSEGNARFREILKLISKVPEVKRLDLFSYLALPMQRLPR